MTRMPRMMALVALVVWPMMVTAEENEEKSMGTVVVTATRTEQPLEQANTSISVITADDIQQRHVNSLVDLLRDVPGVDVTQSGSAGTTASVFIRGADADQTLVLIDGVEMNSPTLGEFNFGPLTPDNVDRVEVLRGAGGSLYGSQAVGGVINMITKRGEGTPQFSLLNEGGNGDSQRHLMDFSGAEGLLGFSGAVSYESTGGFQPVNDDYNNLGGNLRLDADLIEHGTLRGFFRYYDADTGLFNNLNFLPSPTPDPNARFSEERYLAKGEWEHRPFDALSYKLSGYVMHDTETFSDPDAVSTGSFAQHSQIPTQITDGDGQVNYYFSSLGITTAGFVFQEKEARPKSTNVNFTPPPATVEQDFSSSRSIYAGYLQQQLMLLDERLIAIGGFRVDSDQDFGREVSPSWSVGYLQDWDGTSTWSTRVKGSYAEGFNAPTFNELFFPGFGNPNLGPETSSEYDGGAEQHLWGEHLLVDATYFTRRTKNLIEGVFDPTTGLFMAQNIGRVDAQGVETGLSVHPFNGFSFRGNYTYLDFNVHGGSGTLLRRPHNRMAAVAQYHRAATLLPGDEIDLVTNVNFVGDRSDIDPVTFQTTDNSNYTVTGLAFTYSLPAPAAHLQRVAVYTRISNLFDRNYQQVLGFQSMPLNYVVGATLTF